MPTNPFAQAKWIKVVEPVLKGKGERPAYWVSREFDASPGSAVLRISAQGLYQAYLNGVRVGNEELTPGSTQYRKRIQFQTYDVELEAGHNKLEILVADGWFRGAADVMRSDLQFGDHVAVIAEITDVVQTDESWKSSPSHILGADLFLGQVEDRNLLSVRDWSPVEPIDVSAELVQPIAPPVKRIQEIKPVGITKLGEAFIVNFGQNINGWTRLNRLGPAGNKTTITHAEFVGADGNIDTSHLDAFFPFMPEPIRDHQIDSVISAGIDGDFFEPTFTTHGFQYVRVEGFHGELTAEDITAIVVHTHLRKLGTFTSTDRRLTWLHEAADWTFRGNACDLPTDCPTRERAGWSGDWQIFADTAAYLYDIDGFSRKWLADAVIDQHVDGRIANISPVTSHDLFASPMAVLNGSSGWGDVIIQAPLTAYRAYAKTEALEECFDAMQKWLDYGLRSAEQGRHPSRTGEPQPHERYLWDTGFHWGEWMEPGVAPDPFGGIKLDQSEVASAYLYRSCRDFAEVCRILAKPVEIAERYEALAENIRAAWQLEFLDGYGCVKTKTQAAMVRPLAFGLIENREAVAAELAAIIRANGNRLGTGFLSTVYLLPVLAENGQAETAFDLLLQEQQPSWLYMRNKGATTMWEMWDGISEDGKPKMSLNHYSKGAVASFLHHHVAGMKAVRPGYQEFVVEPVFDDRVPDAATSFDSPFGLISAGWRREGESIVIEVSAPALASGLIRLPDGREITVPSGEVIVTNYTPQSSN
jgi:alpha-L-rhamnosidase